MEKLIIFVKYYFFVWAGENPSEQPMKNRLVDLKFPKGYIELYLGNGMVLRAPAGLFPEIKRLPTKDRQDWQILNGEGFTFRKSDAGFHLRQFGLH